MTAEERAEIVWKQFNLGADGHTVVAYKTYIAKAILEAEEAAWLEGYEKGYLKGVDESHPPTRG